VGRIASIDLDENEAEVTVVRPRGVGRKTFKHTAVKAKAENPDG